MFQFVKQAQPAPIFQCCLIGGMTHTKDSTRYMANQKGLKSWKLGHSPRLHLSAAWSDTWSTNDDHVALAAEQCFRSDEKQIS